MQALASTGQHTALSSLLHNLLDVMRHRHFLERGFELDVNTDNTLTPRMRASLGTAYAVCGKLEHALGVVRSLPIDYQLGMGMMYRRVPKFSPYGFVCCACAQRLGLPRASSSRAR